MSFFRKWFFFKWVESCIQNPYRIFFICSVFIFINVIFDGTLFRIRKLYLSRKILIEKSYEIKKKNQKILEKLEKIKDPQFLEKEIRNRFDLAGEGDLIFIFPEDE